MSKRFDNSTLDDSWFEPDTLVYLEGSFSSGCTKKEMKDLLDSLNIKWCTYLPGHNITKIITTKSYYNLKYNLSGDFKKLYDKLNQKVYHPKDILAKIKNIDAEDLSEYSDQIMTLLKSEDNVNIELAVTLIGDKLLEPKWVPWMLLKKDNKSMKELLRKNNIAIGQWHVYNLKWDVKRQIRYMIERLNVNDDYVEEFIIEFLKETKCIK